MVFNDISIEQLALYAARTDAQKDENKTRVSPWYAACSCRGLIEAGGEEKIKGLSRLIDQMGFLEQSQDPNDKSELHSVRGMIAALSGRYFNSSGEASQLLKEWQN